jgi:hypothetical protein
MILEVAVGTYEWKSQWRKERLRWSHKIKSVRIVSTNKGKVTKVMLNM